MNSRYSVTLSWSEEDQGFVADVPELPGCMAHGESYESALANVREAIRLAIEGRDADGWYTLPCCQRDERTTGHGRQH